VAASICCIIKPKRRVTGILLFALTAAWGSDPNETDGDGSTLLYAARTREGLTAQDLARKYGHAYLTGSLTVAAR